MHKLFRFHAHAFMWRHIWSEEFLALVLALFIFISPASAIIRFTERGLFMTSTTPSATTSWTLNLRYTTAALVGSFDMRFCMDPIPYHPCVTPPGLNISNATLSNQTGETGFAIGSISTMAQDLSGPGNTADPPNHIVLTRTPTMVTPGAMSTYTFQNIVNPNSTSQAFSIRLMSLASTNGSGPQIDVGSVRGQVAEGIVIETQVPPILTFCVAEQVDADCTGTNDVYYSDMGLLDSTKTLTAVSQMGVGTNATSGFAITAYGGPPAAGTNVIDTPTIPTESTRGSNQFGINLVANSTPAIGADPAGDSSAAAVGPMYSVPNKFKYKDGEVLAASPGVSLIKKYTVSYIFNSSDNLKAGVYSTTINYIATGMF